MANEYYHWYKAHGLCPLCHTQKIAKGKAACLNCLSLNAEAVRKSRDNFTPEQKARADKQSRDSHKRDYMMSAKRRVYAQSVADTRRGKDVQSALSVRSEQTEPQRSTAEKAG